MNWLSRFFSYRSQRGGAGSDLWRQREQERSERGTLSRARGRQGIIFVLLGLALFGLLSRVAYWQIAQQSTLAARAAAEDLQAFQIPAGRGMIYDTAGRVLALSITEDTVIVDPNVLREIHALDATVATLSQALSLSSALVRSQINVPGAYAQLRDANGQTLLLTRAQSATITAAIERGDLSGVALYPQVERVYPEGALAAQALGFVRASDGVGQYGVEQEEQAMLAGTPGLLYTAVDAQGQPLATAPQRETPAVPGANVTLTIDANVQYWVEQELAQTVAQLQGAGGTVIVMDAHTGAIIAMANVPTFDPNAYGQASLASFSNPAISQIYDPGSVMKAITMAAGVNEGLITPGTTIEDPGYIVVDGVTIHNWDRRDHGQETMTQVLQYSANVGASWVALHLGQQTFDGYLSAFGFEKPTGIDLPGEAAGLTAQSSSPNEAQLTLAENSFGESIGVTSMQMVAAYGALANGGVLMRPYVVSSIAANGGQGNVTRFGPHAVRQVISAASAQTVTQMLVDSALNSEAEMNRVKGYTVAAKTGTSTPDPANPSNTYASIVGYAPATNPRFVLLAQIDQPKTNIFAGGAVGPLWREIAQQLFAYYRIPPDAPVTSGAA